MCVWRLPKNHPDNLQFPVERHQVQSLRRQCFDHSQVSRRTRSIVRCGSRSLEKCNRAQGVFGKIARGARASSSVNIKKRTSSKEYLRPVSNAIEP